MSFRKKINKDHNDKKSNFLLSFDEKLMDFYEKYSIKWEERTNTSKDELEKLFYLSCAAGVASIATITGAYLLILGSGFLIQRALKSGTQSWHKKLSSNIANDLIYGEDNGPEMQALFDLGLLTAGCLFTVTSITEIIQGIGMNDPKYIKFASLDLMLGVTAISYLSGSTIARIENNTPFKKYKRKIEEKEVNNNLEYKDNDHIFNQYVNNM